MGILKKPVTLGRFAFAIVEKDMKINSFTCRAGRLVSIEIEAVALDSAIFVLAY